MPVIKSAKKKLRKDRKLEKLNNAFRKELSNALKTAKKTKTSEKVRAAVKLVDKAVKKRIIHKNKAARLKSSLSKLTAHQKRIKKEAKPSAKKPQKRGKK